MALASSFFVRHLFFRYLQELCWCHNGYTAEGMQNQEIGVACDDMGSTAADGQLQELVVLGITTRTDFFGGLDEKRFINEGCQEFLSLSSGHISLEPPPLEHFGQFLNGG